MEGAVTLKGLSADAKNDNLICLVLTFRFDAYNIKLQYLVLLKVCDRKAVVVLPSQCSFSEKLFLLLELISDFRGI